MCVFPQQTKPILIQDVESKKQIHIVILKEKKCSIFLQAGGKGDHS